MNALRSLKENDADFFLTYLWSPTRKSKSDVSGPRTTSSFLVIDFIFFRQSRAKLATTNAWLSLGSGNPATSRKT